MRAPLHSMPRASCPSPLRALPLAPVRRAVRVAGLVSCVPSSVSQRAPGRIVGVCAVSWALLRPMSQETLAACPFLLQYNLCLAIQILPIQAAAAVTIQCLYRDTTCLPSQASLQYNPFYCNILLAHCNTMTPLLTYCNTNLTYCNTLP